MDKELMRVKIDYQTLEMAFLGLCELLREKQLIDRQSLAHMERQGSAFLARLPFDSAELQDLLGSELQESWHRLMRKVQG